jgi:hypothetical protein
MTLPLPQLDKRTWQDLVDEGLARIHRRAPEWTDYNLHDPGITLLELLAYKSEQKLYQANRVTDRLLTNVYRLMNNDASSVSTSVVAFTGATEPTPMARHTEFELIQKVEYGNQAAEPKHIRLKNSITVHKIKLTSITVGGIPDGLRRIASGMGVRTDSSEIPADAAEHKLFSFELEGEANSPRRISIYIEIHDNLLQQSSFQPSSSDLQCDWPLRIFFRVGTGKRSAIQRNCVLRDETNSFRNSGILLIKIPCEATSVTCFWQGDVPWPVHRRIQNIVLNAARVEHCRGMNSSDQDKISSFEIDEHGFHSADLGVPASRVQLQCKTMDHVNQISVTNWTQCQSLMTATERDSWFELDGTVLRFGNGKNGMRPPGDGFLSASYVVRQSIEGVVVGSRWRPTVEKPCKVEVTTIEAPVADLRKGDARRGIQSESRNLSASMQLAELALRNDGTLDGLARVRVMSIPAPMNAVIPVDFERLALGLSLPRIARARAYQEVDVTSPGLPGSGTLSLVVYPDIAFETVDEVPSRTLEIAREELANRTKSVIEAVHRRLEAYRVMGTRLVIGIPRLCELRITVTLEPTPSQGLRHKDSRGEELSRVRSSIMQRMTRLFDPVTGGPNEAGCPFGDHVSQREIFAAVSESLEGFALTECEITLSGKWWPWSLPYVTVTIEEGRKQRALR